MATSDRRGLLLRSLPVLVLLTLVLAAAPQPSPSRPQAAVSTSAAVPAPATAEDPATETAATDDPPADHVTALAAQSTASARGCRAPPVASA